MWFWWNNYISRKENITIEIDFGLINQENRRGGKQLIIL